MASAIRTLVAVDTGIDTRSIEDVLPNDASIQLIGIVKGMDESWRALQDSDVDLLVVACIGYSDRALFLIEGARKLDAARPILVLSENSPNGFLRRAFEAGAEDILMLPQPRAQIAFAVQKVLARRDGFGGGGERMGRMTCVLGPKGGTGKTLVACNLAVALAEAGERVALVDLDLQFGDVALCLGLSPDLTIHDLAASGGSLDTGKLDDFLVAHPSGLRCLLTPAGPTASAISVDLLREVYAVLRLTYDYVIIDTPPGFTAEVIASIDASSDLIMVGMLDSLSLKNTKLGLETLELMGYDATRIKLVLNRAHSRVGISISDVVAVLGRDPDIFIPSDREIPRAVNEGIPIVLGRPQSEPAQAFSTAGRARDRQTTGRRRPRRPTANRDAGSSEERHRWNSTRD